MVTVPFSSTVLRTGIPFGVILGAYFIFIGGFANGIVGGIIAGAFFGTAMAGFVLLQSKKARSNTPAFSGENLIEEGPANHFMNGEAVGGWLYLTDKQVFFKSHRVNLQVHEISIPRDQIRDVSLAKSLWLIPNQLCLRLADGRTERFVVNKPRYWIELINSETLSI